MISCNTIKVSLLVVHFINNGDICHGRHSNLVEFEILLVETPIGLSTKCSMEEIPTGLSTVAFQILPDLTFYHPSRNSNLVEFVILQIRLYHPDINYSKL